jgi:DNA-binding NarL/FixJ family response regulator
MVLVACDIAENRRRWGQRLQEAFAICEVAARRGLEQIMRELQPHVLVLDLHLPDLEEVNDISDLQNLSPRTKIIALVPRVDDREGIAALEAGARGYCSRDIDPGQLRKAVEKVQDGELWIERRLVAALVDALRCVERSSGARFVPDGPAFDGLTPRKCQVAELITEGACNKEIARQLNISERTVKAYMTELFQNFNVSDRLQLAVLLNRLRPPELASAGSGR